jgi:hypothetical protein
MRRVALRCPSGVLLTCEKSSIPCLFWGSGCERLCSMVVGDGRSKSSPKSSASDRELSELSCSLSSVSCSADATGCASPSELLASPSELLASPSEFSASPSELLASPSELSASPGPLRASEGLVPTCAVHAQFCERQHVVRHRHHPLREGQRLSRAHKSTNGTLRVVKVWQF